MWCECESSLLSEEWKKKGNRNWHEKLIQFITVKSLLANDKQGEMEVSERERGKEWNCVITFYKANAFLFYFHPEEEGYF